MMDAMKTVPPACRDSASRLFLMFSAIRREDIPYALSFCACRPARDGLAAVFGEQITELQQLFEMFARGALRGARRHQSALSEAAEQRDPIELGPQGAFPGVRPEAVVVATVTRQRD